MARNFDYPRPVEGRMAKGYLWQAEQDARALREQLRDDDDLPGWTLVKMGTAADRLHTVHRYLGYKISRAQARKNGSCNHNYAGCGCSFPAFNNPAGTSGIATGVGVTLAAVGVLVALDYMRKAR